MWLSHESIYQAVYRPESALSGPSKFAPHRPSPLRTGRDHRKAQRRTESPIRQAEWAAFLHGPSQRANFVECVTETVRGMPEAAPSPIACDYPFPWVASRHTLSRVNGWWWARTPSARVIALPTAGATGL